LKDRLNPDLTAMINGSDAIVVGNIYKDVLPELNAVNDKLMIDLTRINRNRVSGDSYDGICW